MTTIREYAINIAANGTCTTEGVKPINEQIFELAQPLLTVDLVKCDDLVRVVGPSAIPFLQPAAKAALAKAVAEKGEKLPLTHAYRTLAHQYVLYHWYKNGRKCGVSLAALPGSSPHEQGIAIDIGEGQYSKWITVLGKYKWRWRGNDDKPHFTYIGGPTSLNVRKESIRAFQRLWNQHNPTDLIQEDGTYGEIETGPRLAKSPVEGF